LGLFGPSVSALNTFQQEMNVFGNNIANSNTVGFKSSQVNFADLLSQTLTQGSGGSTTGLGGTNPMQVGLGVQLASTDANFSQGALSQTSNPNDVAINGNGFFAVASNPNPTTSTPPATIHYTRAGDFSVDSNGYLVTPNGQYVLGYAANTSNSYPEPNPTTTAPQAITIDSSDSQANSFTIGANGSVTIGSNTTPSYYIPMAMFVNPQGLVSDGSNEYTASGNSGGVEYYQAGSTGVGKLEQGFLESSNVNLSSQLTKIMEAQAGYEASGKVINTQDQMIMNLLQEV
jgi:flagellar hook protein FlgE